MKEHMTMNYTQSIFKSCLLTFQKKTISIISIVFLSLYACSSNYQENKVSKKDYELQVIKAAIPYLIPEELPCSLVPIENESDEDFTKRLMHSTQELILLESRLKFQTC